MWLKISDLDQLKTQLPIVVIRTQWSEIEQRVRSLIERPLVNSLDDHSLMIVEDPQPVTGASQRVQSIDQPMDTSKSNEDEIKLKSSNNRDEELGDDAMTTGASGAMSSRDMTNVDDLKEENERLKNERLCVVCLGREKNVLFLPCAHLTACLECSLSLQNCPMCRSKIQATVRTFT